MQDKVDGLEHKFAPVKKFLVPLAIIGAIGTAYFGMREYAREERDLYNLRAHNETMVCYALRGFEHNECWDTESARRSRFYSDLYDELTFWE